MADKKRTSSSAEDFVVASSVSVRRCGICTTPAALAFMRASLEAMHKHGIVVSRYRMSLKLSEVAGKKIHENTVRTHWLESHDPNAAGGGKPPEKPPRGS